VFSRFIRFSGQRLHGLHHKSLSQGTAGTQIFHSAPLFIRIHPSHPRRHLVSSAVKSDSVFCLLPRIQPLGVDYIDITGIFMSVIDGVAQVPHKIRVKPYPNHLTRAAQMDNGELKMDNERVLAQTLIFQEKTTKNHFFSLEIKAIWLVTAYIECGEKSMSAVVFFLKTAYYFDKGPR
jgi:hypothetical protein